MSATNDLARRIAGRTRQAIGEIIGDQDLHEQGKAQARPDAPDDADPHARPQPPKPPA